MLLRSALDWKNIMAYTSNYGKNFHKLKGMDVVLKNYRMEVAKIKAGALKGLISSQSQIRKSMDTTPPKIPVDTGNMRNSYFCVTSNGAVIAGASPKFKEKRGDVERLTTEHALTIKSALADVAARGKAYGPHVIFGLSAYYTKNVHDNHTMEFKRKGAGPEFFTAAIKRHKRKLLKIIKEAARLRK